LAVPPPSNAPPARDPNDRLIVIAAVAAILIVAVGVVGVALALAQGHGTPPPAASGTPTPSASPGLVTPATLLSASTGTLVFADDFHDAGSGWDAVTGSTDADYAYSNGAYVVVAKGGYFYYEPAPYTEPKQQLSVSVTATLDVHTPPDAGFGMDCYRGSGSALVSYEFSADADANWYVMRATGETSSTTPSTLEHGSLGSASAPGVIPVTLVGVCATEADGQTTRLALFIDGKKVADLTDSTPVSPNQGWKADLMTAGSDSRAVTVTVTRFEERDLSRSGP